MNIQTEKDKDGYKRLCCEILLRAFNDILSNQFYQYHVVQWLKYKRKASKKLLDKHNDSIYWLMNERTHVCFQILEITHLSQEKIIKAISEKFNSPNKFKKFYTCFAKECETGWK